MTDELRLGRVEPNRLRVDDLPGYEAHVAAMEAKVAELMARLEALGDGSYGVGREAVRKDEERDDLRTAIAQLHRGVTIEEGCLEELNGFLGRPGLTKSRWILAQLKEKAAVNAAQAATDPDEKHMYRLKMRKDQDGNYTRHGNCYVEFGEPNASGNRDLRRLQPGELIELTNRRAAAIGDILERAPVS